MLSDDAINKLILPILRRQENINNYVNNSESSKKHRNNSGINEPMTHSINNYINV